jgi:hypothetical protein
MVAIEGMCRHAACVLLARMQQRTRGAFERRCFIKASQTFQGQLKHGLSRLCRGSVKAAHHVAASPPASDGIADDRRQIQGAPESETRIALQRGSAAVARHVPCAMCKLGVLLFRAKQGALAGRVPFGRVLSTLSALPCLFLNCLPPAGIWYLVFDRHATDMSTNAKTGLRKQPVARSPQSATAAP